jgi:hypothetical protein
MDNPHDRIIENRRRQSVRAYHGEGPGSASVPCREGARSASVSGSASRAAPSERSDAKGGWVCVCVSVRVRVAPSERSGARGMGLCLRLGLRPCRAERAKRREGAGSVSVSRSASVPCRASEATRRGMGLCVCLGPRPCRAERAKRREEGWVFVRVRVWVCVRAVPSERSDARGAGSVSVSRSASVTRRASEATRGGWVCVCVWVRVRAVRSERSDAKGGWVCVCVSVRVRAVPSERSDARGMGLCLRLGGSVSASGSAYAPCRASEAMRGGLGLCLCLGPRPCRAERAKRREGGMGLCPCPAERAKRSEPRDPSRNVSRVIQATRFARERVGGLGAKPPDQKKKRPQPLC